ncbi:hypothetical protein [Flavivirga spongiicola]|uniref:Uncharacterized protein n=1 Tax=Flavivirga spongiicola TaxID=421621 RepID=A0ABU7XVU3_9FLAO|nr:hypothetical protein [Flavivirga sp. MEBiC05379]MDO5979901.1 hypothetical protein [Flavivirga sp. MEBiC05379]
MRHFIFFIALLNISTMVAQEESDKTLDGTYHLLFEERGITTKHIQFVEKNDAKMLLIASCEKCFPAMYQYRPEESESIGQSVFYAMGIFIISYDAESFIAVVPSLDENTAFAFSNFYSKNKTTLKMMTKEKIEAYASKL